MVQPVARWALVTGASSGIGRAFAWELAARGYALVLTARRSERLRALADELHTRHACATRVLALDLADPQAPETLFHHTQQAGIVIDFLVNNAGYGVPGPFLKHPWQEHRDFMQVLVIAPSELCYRYLPDMVRRRQGYIINVASLAGHMPGSRGQTQYAAAKAFSIKLSQSLALEQRAANVGVCAVCPGFTYSEFHDVTGTRPQVARTPKWLWMDAARVAREGVDAVLRGEVVYVPGRVNRLIRWLSQHLPARLMLELMARQSARFRAIE